VCYEVLHGISDLDGFMDEPRRWKMNLRRPRHRWDNIDIDLKGPGLEDAVCIEQALVNTAMNLWVPQNAGNFLTS
jgi:hypothetical protein